MCVGATSGKRLDCITSFCHRSNARYTLHGFEYTGPKKTSRSGRLCIKNHLNSFCRARSLNLDEGPVCITDIEEADLPLDIANAESCDISFKS